MQFEVILILFGLLILLLLWFTNILVGYLKIASLLKKFKHQVVDSIILLLDIYPSVQKTLSVETDLSAFLVLKKDIWSTTDQDFNKLWIKFVPTLELLTSNKSVLQNGSDLALKLEVSLNELAEFVHLYNNEVLIFHKKQESRLFLLFNKVFLGFNLPEIQPLSR